MATSIDITEATEARKTLEREIVELVLNRWWSPRTAIWNFWWFFTTFERIYSNFHIFRLIYLLCERNDSMKNAAIISTVVGRGSNTRMKEIYRRSDDMQTTLCALLWKRFGNCLLKFYLISSFKWTFINYKWKYAISLQYERRKKSKTPNWYNWTLFIWITPQNVSNINERAVVSVQRLIFYCLTCTWY